MEGERRTRIVLHVVEAVYALAAAAWIAIPLAGDCGRRRLRRSWDAPRRCGRGADRRVGARRGRWRGFVLKLLSIPLDRAFPVLCDPTRPVPIGLNFTLSAGVIALFAVAMLRDAANGRYFAALPLPQYGAFAVSLAWNATSIALLLGWLNRRDPSYREYLEFRRRGGGRAPIAGLTPHGIQQRLALTYIPLILLAIAVLSWVLMRDYSRTLLATVIDGGLSLAERTAGTVKANADDLIAVEDVLDGEAARNRGAHLPFGAITLYWKAPKDRVGLRGGRAPTARGRGRRCPRATSPPRRLPAAGRRQPSTSSARRSASAASPSAGSGWSTRATSSTSPCSAAR